MEKKRQNRIYIVTECPYVGIFQAIFDLSKVLHSLNFELVYVFPKVSRDRYGEKQILHEEILEEYGTVKYTSLRRKYRYLLMDLFQFYKFSKELRDGDIIISFTEYAGKLNRLCRLFNRKIKYYHSHQCIDVFRKSNFAYYFEFLFEKILASSVDNYIACSPSEVSLLQNVFKVPSNKIIFAPNYRDFDVSCLKNKEAKQFEFIYVGRMVREKGVWELAKIFDSLRISDRLTCVGGGPDLDRLQSNYPDITFTGHLSHSDVLGLLKNSRYLISNSKIEGLPYSVLEAMTFGVIPVLSYVHGHKDLVISGITGFLYKNDEEMRDMIFKVANLDTHAYTEISNNVVQLSKNLEIFGKRILEKHFKEYE